MYVDVSENILHIQETTKYFNIICRHGRIPIFSQNKKVVSCMSTHFQRLQKNQQKTFYQKVIIDYDFVQKLSKYHLKSNFFLENGCFPHWNFTK